MKKIFGHFISKLSVSTTVKCIKEKAYLNLQGQEYVKVDKEKHARREAEADFAFLEQRQEKEKRGF